MLVIECGLFKTWDRMIESDFVTRFSKSFLTKGTYFVSIDKQVYTFPKQGAYHRCGF